MRNAFNPMETVNIHDGFMMSGSYTFSFSTEIMSSGLWTMEIIMPQGMQTVPMLISK
jgi:hypothetical protein